MCACSYTYLCACICVYVCKCQRECECEFVFAHLLNPKMRMHNGRYSYLMGFGGKGGGISLHFYLTLTHREDAGCRGWRQC